MSFDFEQVNGQDYGGPCERETGFEKNKRSRIRVLIPF